MMLKRKFIVIFGTLFVLSLATLGFTVSRLKMLSDNLREIVNERYEKLAKLNSVEKEVLTIAQYLRDVLIVDDPKKADEYIGKIRTYQSKIAEELEYLEKTIIREAGKQSLKDIKEGREKYIQTREEQFKALQSGNKALAVELLQTKVNTAQEAYIKVLDAGIAYQRKTIEISLNDADREYLNSIIISIASGCVFLVFMIVSLLLLTKGIAVPLHEGVLLAEAISSGDLSKSVYTECSLSSGCRDEVGILMGALEKMRRMLSDNMTMISTSAIQLASASTELSHTVQKMSFSVRDQSDKASQVASASTEMSQTVMDIARNATSISASAMETSTIAKEGAGVVTHTVSEVEGIAKTVSESAQLITSLGDRSRQIGEIVNVIKDIADQTNLLALNAAIEAARAGEQGRGFAVVADEVRKLAERTSKATTEIGGMITAIQRETQQVVTTMNNGSQRVVNGVELVNKAGDSLKSIVESVDGLQSMVHQIASATEEMSQVSEQITGDIEIIANVSRDTNLSAAQIGEASDDLAKLSNELKSVTSRFVIDGYQHKGGSQRMLSS
ncbi:methyl-accepting chemotaxis protein [Candidatus Magnetomonas plexicatena]|nr:methyl-accepting chemotaxis protein [Nitrospirales bacterium LBB_01]